ncbi:hypothetical protein [Mycobacteroides abscessus]|uniref:hypothetical protein n=1 Tax=Mycobacteroides abscessus TaxID=36809 RepID=UPI000926939B|nr:hypothetical protein [Mycobacteroides abscessus]SHQ48686.1 Uncharacterised protein [Mycobacteroides abscessus subsp. abscessus]SHQ50372.1 Uncharacterised protein [Mycobacteroides abscessus subsp. abscessus]SKQ83556.1 Uncharacterised protein [Mycobacteroides abscessus subsp. massiliense]SKQ85223.1 Uncharacterised protein [Mycobacteroides abscessus subsp. massiliense]SLC49165.1 Uncharacterised protein [Mycobacteroides abscessus subsp. massiliense]
MTVDDEKPRKATWTIRLEGKDLDQWDELLYSLRRETGRRTLNRADIMRALVDLASNKNATARSALIDTLSREGA